MTYNGQIKGFEYLNPAPGKDVLPGDQARDLTQTVRSLYTLQSSMSAQLDNLIAQLKAHITDYHNPHQLGDDFLSDIIKTMFFQVFTDGLTSVDTDDKSMTLDEFVAAATANPTVIPELIRAWQLGTLSIPAYTDDLFSTTGAELIVQGRGPIAYWESPYCDPFFPYYSAMSLDTTAYKIVLSVYSPSRRDGSPYATTIASLSTMVPYGTYPGQFTVPGDHYIRWSLRPEEVLSLQDMPHLNSTRQFLPMVYWSNLVDNHSIMIAVFKNTDGSFVAELGITPFGGATNAPQASIMATKMDAPDIIVAISGGTATIYYLSQGVISSQSAAISSNLVNIGNNVTVVTNCPIDYDQTYMSEYEPQGNNTWTGTTPIPPKDRPQFGRTEKLGIYGGIPSVPTLYSFLGSQSTGA